MKTHRINEEQTRNEMKSKYMSYEPITGKYEMLNLDYFPLRH